MGVNVEVPTSLTERQRELLELLAKELGDEVQHQRKGFIDKLRDLCGEANERRDNLVDRDRRELGDLADRRAAVDVEQQERGTQLQVERGPSFVRTGTATSRGSRGNGGWRSDVSNAWDTTS